MFKSCVVLFLLSFSSVAGWHVGCGTNRGFSLRMSSSSSSSSSPHVVVIGGGFGGFGAAKGLCENGCKVTLVDAAEPTGKEPVVTKNGRPFESGHKGFWRDYPNIYTMINAYLKIDENDIFTKWTNSSFYSPYGLEATAPLWSELPWGELPSPLGQVLASAQLFTRLPIADRVTLAGLLFAMLDYNRNEEIYASYDRMTAHELFLRMGLSKRLVDDFITPTLLVGLFKPPEELSAALVMDLLYFYAFAHQTSFDVRWMRKGTIASSIIKPLVEKLEDQHDLKIMPYSRVDSIGMKTSQSNQVGSIEYSTYDKSTDSVEKGKLDDIDAVVLAVGAKGMKTIINGSPELGKISSELSNAASMNAISCISVRIWLDKVVPTLCPANVFSRFEDLRGAGGTFFMLDQLQTGTDLWNEEREDKGSVVACDFYNSGALMSLSDEEILSILKDRLLPSAVPAFNDADVVDFEVRKYADAVSWFSPGSYRTRPSLAVKGVSNIVCAGDWVKLGDREHGAKGLCQERAFVSGLEAANQLARNGVLKGSKGQMAEVIPVREDEVQVQLGRELNKRVMSVLDPLGLGSFWVR